MYTKNRYYIVPQEQEKIKDVKILLGGAGLGSNIAECALRTGFENITIIDGDGVEVSNLNRQNYTGKDIGKAKAETLAKRLLSINPNANITFRNEFITRENVAEIVSGHHLAINALDFATDLPFVFDRHCTEQGISILHPYNLGRAACVFVVVPGGVHPEDVIPEHKNFELNIATYMIKQMRQNNLKTDWIERIYDTYIKEPHKASPPQLSIGSNIAAALSVGVMLDIVAQRPVSPFPDMHVVSTVL